MTKRWMTILANKARLGMRAAVMAAGLAFWGAAAMTAQAAPPGPGWDQAPIVTEHQMNAGGKRLAYTAEVGRVAIRDVETGNPHGYVFYTAYRLKPEGSSKTRPIAFIWNGGPGWPSLPLHFEVAGPKRENGTAIIDNADTWLTDSDLVFVDPVGTGYSRPVSAEMSPEFTSIVGDVAATTEFVRSWLLLHDADDARLIIAGESYGSRRAGNVGYEMLKRGFDVRGIALISNTSSLPSYEDQSRTAAVYHVGDFAVVALYYKKLPADLGTTPESAREIAERWVRDTYFPAIKRLDSLTPEERESLAVELARHTGLQPEQINRKTLIVSQGAYLGLIVPGKRMIPSDFRRSEAPPTPYVPAALQYLRRDLGYRTDLPYLGVGGTYQDGFAPNGTYPKPVGERWVNATVYGATPEQLEQARVEFEKLGVLGQPHFGPTMPGAGEAIALKPSIKVFVPHGAYDPLGGCSIDAELARHLTSPYKDAVKFTCYLGAHQFYHEPAERTRFSNDMRTFMRSIAMEP